MIKLDRQLYRLSAVIAGLSLNFQNLSTEDKDILERRDNLMKDLNKSLVDLRELNEMLRENDDSKN